jgi:phage N-6-adenine-methyltransferase
MGAIIKRDYYLPDTLEDLTKFALIGREKLTSVKAEIRAIDKVGLAKEVREQKREEAQMLAEALLDAEARIGELLRAIPKATKGTGSNQYRSAEICTAEHFSKPVTKNEVIKDLGFNQSQAQRFETLADNLDVIEQVKAEARENEELPTRTEVLRRVNKPHVANNAGNNEWYTPIEYIEAAKKVMGEIDLDPASSVIANQIIQAKNIYTAEDDGLSKSWFDKVWLNPPYANPLIGQFISKLAMHYHLGEVSESIVLVNNATETEWFNKIIECASAVVFPSSRVKFYSPDGRIAAPLQGQAVIYLGRNPQLFMQYFKLFGWGAMLHE